MLKRLLLSALAIVLSADMQFAQTGVGQIQGTISDATGAVLPGAAVALEHTQTGNKFQTTSSDVGFFVFPSLQAGPYRLRVDSPGMQPWDGQVLVQVGQQAEVNPKLQ